MVIGYSFRDKHINVAIRAAVEKNKILKLFIIGPSGESVLPEDLSEKLKAHRIGASKRGLRETFGGDWVAHGMVIQFFAP